MARLQKKLLLVIPVEVQDDLLPVVESEGWHTVKDLFRKTDTSYNRDWNGKYVLDQDEIPWKVSNEELLCLTPAQGDVVVISDGKYHLAEKLTLFKDTDGSFYVMEDDLEGLFS
ncbi:MAG: hypothetical protein RDU20_18040 [Desulfomonilaceae bacterium]|nr:hypothetical protein [Desulfomonilaceae bacterium]